MWKDIKVYKNNRGITIQRNGRWVNGCNPQTLDKNLRWKERKTVDVLQLVIQHEYNRGLPEKLGK